MVADDGTTSGAKHQVSEEEMRKRLEMLRIEHRDLDAAIDALSAAGTVEMMAG